VYARLLSGESAWLTELYY